MEKLPEDFKKKWIAALRSGEYKQGQSVLYNKDDDSYCCLGVAASICGVSKWDIQGRPYVGTGHENYFPIINGYPTILSKQYGSRGDSEASTLADMNDQGKSFTEIADYIEKNL